MPHEKDDDLSNEILALVNDDSPDSDPGSDHPHHHTTNINNGNSSDSNLSASSSTSDLSLTSSNIKRHPKRPTKPNNNPQPNNSDDSSSVEDFDELDERLYQMTEIEREQIIAEKAEKNQKKYEQEEIMSRLNRQKKLSGASKESMVESEEGSDKEFLPHSRTSKSKVSRTQVLKELKQRRNQKHHKRNSRHSSGSSSDSSFVKSPSRSPKQRRTPEEIDSSPVIQNVTELGPIILPRSYISLNVHKRFFEKTIRGCFVSVAFGKYPDGSSAYRLGKIESVIDTKESYDLDKTRTHRILELSYGDVKETFSMVEVSNKPLSDYEFQRYMEKANEVNQALITQNYVTKKFQEIEDEKKRALTDEDHYYTMRSQSLSSQKIRPLEIQKNNLEGRIRIARENGDEELLSKLESELSETETLLKPLLEKYEAELKIVEEQEAVKREEKLKIARGLELQAKEALKKVPEPVKVIESDDEAGEFTCFNLTYTKQSNLENLELPPPKIGFSKRDVTSTLPMSTKETTLRKHLFQYKQLWF